MRQEIGTLSFEILRTSPVIRRMQGRPEHPEWRRLSELGERPALAPFRKSLSSIVRDAFQTGAEFIRLNEARPTDGTTAIPYASCRSAAELAEANAEQSPGAALLLAVASVIAWNRSGAYPNDDVSKSPPPGWSIIPHACAVAGVQAGAFRATLALIDEAYDVMYSISITSFFEDHPHPGLRKYRRIARLAAEAYEGCIRDLADDLRNSCLTEGVENFRPEFCALLWALGYVPQSYAFAINKLLPGRQLCQQVVRKSIQNLALDRLTQFIWLAMRDRGPFDLRQHESLFANITFVYEPNRRDATVSHFLWPKDPNAVVADVLIRWFSGTLTKNEVELLRYITFLYDEFGLTVDDRFRVLFNLICVGQSRTPGDLEDAKALEKMVSDVYTAVERKWWLQLSLPHVDPGSLMTRSLGSHYLIEACMSQALHSGDAKFADEMYVFLEQLRRADDPYWNLVQPVRPDESEARAVAPLLNREKELIREARGAYLMMLASKLPRHYRLFRLSPEESPNAWKATAQHGSEQMERIVTELQVLYQGGEKQAPRYIQARKGAIPWDHVLSSLAFT